MLLLTKDGLAERQKFNDSESYFVFSHGDWTVSTIRTNLNNTELEESSGGFISTLTSVEQGSLTGLTISQANTILHISYPSGSTTDKIF